MDAYETDQATIDKNKPMDTPAREIISGTYRTSIGPTMR